MKSKIYKEDTIRIEELKKKNREIPIKQGKIIIDVLILKEGE